MRHVLLLLSCGIDPSQSQHNKDARGCGILFENYVTTLLHHVAKHKVSPDSMCLCGSYHRYMIRSGNFVTAFLPELFDKPGQSSCQTTIVSAFYWENRISRSGNSGYFANYRKI